MTAVAENTETDRDDRAATGRVARVIGPVVDVEFSVDTMPEIYNALAGRRHARRRARRR